MTECAADTADTRDCGHFLEGWTAGWDAALCWAGILPEDRPDLAVVLPLEDEQ